MNTPLKFVITLSIFWIVLGGLFQAFGFNDQLEGNEVNIDQEEKNIAQVTISGFTFLWDYFTFNVKGLPTNIRTSLSLFFSISLSLSIYVLVRSGS